MEEPTIRNAEVEDMPNVMGLIRALADYEKAPKEVTNSVDQLIKDGFGEDKIFDCLVALVKGEIVGFALYFTGYSTWKGRTLSLEDFLVKDVFRGNGIGKLLFEEVLKVAKRRKVKRMDWQVLDWNEPAIHFYKKYGATLDGAWLNGRFFEEDIERLTQ